MFKIFAAFLIWAIRGWCTWRGRVRVIRRPSALAIGEPYLIRYALFGWLPGDKRRSRWLPNIYLHNILLPDADPAPHNHPWPWAVSLILDGFYVEERPEYRSADGKRSYWPGDWNKLKPNTFHRIDDVPFYGCWTLFITSGGKRQPWGFAVPGEGFVPHALRRLVTQMQRSARRPLPPSEPLPQRAGQNPDGSCFFCNVKGCGNGCRT